MYIDFVCMGKNICFAVTFNRWLKRILMFILYFHNRIFMKFLLSNGNVAWVNLIQYTDMSKTTKLSKLLAWEQRDKKKLIKSRMSEIFDTKNWVIEMNRKMAQKVLNAVFLLISLSFFPSSQHKIKFYLCGRALSFPTIFFFYFDSSFGAVENFQFFFCFLGKMSPCLYLFSDLSRYSHQNAFCTQKKGSKTTTFERLLQKISSEKVKWWKNGHKKMTTKSKNVLAKKDGKNLFRYICNTKKKSAGKTLTIKWAQAWATKIHTEMYNAPAETSKKREQHALCELQRKWNALILTSLL